MTDTLTTQAELNGHASAVLVDAAGGGRPSATSYGELNRLANRLGHGLASLGARPGERVVWCGPNSLEVVICLHGFRKAGLVSVPLSYRFTAEEMQYVVDNSDATVVVIDAEQAPLLATVRDRLPKVREVVAFGGAVPDGFVSWDELLAASPETEPAPDSPVPDVGGSMIYTSGTTGHPKGAMRTGSDPETVLALLKELRFRAGEEIYLTTGPLYHSGPLMFATLVHSMGGNMVVLPKFEPSAWLRLVAEHHVTNSFSAPTQLKRIVSLPPGELARADMSSMRILVANVAPVPYALKQEVIEKLGDGFLYEIYGSTELGVVSVLPPEDQLRKPGSCGKTYGPVEVKVVDDNGKEVPVGEPGELFIRTRLAMDGYYRSDETLPALADASWKSVGDIAYLDDEGYIYICDRKKDMIISGGVNIYPAEIEAVLHHHPQILDVAVFGIPDDEWGESVYAILQPRPGETLDVDEVDAFVSERLASYKRPRVYEVRDELPRTESGKLLKRLLRDEFWQDRDPSGMNQAANTTRTLAEDASAALLAEYGIPVAPSARVEGADAAVGAADRIGYPVVAKLVGDAIAHKTDRGLVRLGLRDADVVRAAAADLLAAARPQDGKVGVLIAAMLRGNRELVAGVVRDPQFGACVMIGFGGVLTEAIADVAFIPVPLDELDVAEAIEALRTQALLGPVRGEPAVDRNALATVLCGLAALAEARPEVVSVDVNPLIVVDGKPVAVDALVEVAL